MPRDNAPSCPRPLPAPALAARFLFLPPDPRDGEQLRWSRGAPYVPLWGLAVGILYAIVFRLAWRVFGEYQGIRWLPVMAVLATDLILCGYRMLHGAVALLSARNPDKASAPLDLRALLAVAMIVLCKFCLLASLPIGTWQSPPSGSWRWNAVLGHLGPLYPSTIYRPLILAPLWGRWAVLLALTVGRAAPGASQRLQQMARGLSLRPVVGAWLACAGLTLLYCSGSGEHVARGVVLALVTMVVGYLAGFALARRAGGQTEATTAAAGLVTELAFLTCYVAVSNTIYWY